MSGRKEWEEGKGRGRGESAGLGLHCLCSPGKRQAPARGEAASRAGSTAQACVPARHLSGEAAGLADPAVLGLGELGAGPWDGLC